MGVGWVVGAAERGDVEGLGSCLRRNDGGGCRNDGGGAGMMEGGAGMMGERGSEGGAAWVIGAR